MERYCVRVPPSTPFLSRWKGGGGSLSSPQAFASGLCLCLCCGKAKLRAKQEIAPLVWSGNEEKNIHGILNLSHCICMRSLDRSCSGEKQTVFCNNNVGVYLCGSFLFLFFFLRKRRLIVNLCDIESTSVLLRSALCVFSAVPSGISTVTLC